MSEPPSHNSSFVFSSRFLRWLGIAFFVLLIIRVGLIFQIPFTDTTEARYAEIARKMVETNDWITPQFDYGVPFWGKPPLHTWLSALGIKLFGANALGARIFIFLTAVGLLTMLFRWAKRMKGRDYALAGTFIVASNILFFISSATVMTDLAMVAGTTLCMLGFWDNLHRKDQSTWKRYLFFIGLTIGLLAKGPVATVVSAVPIGLWVLLNNRWVDTWKKMPWLTGLLLTLALTLPWYIMAELKTPGFLEYFIVGEHYQRFVDSGWTGDLYGKGHAHAKGMIWVYSLVVMLPWTPFILAPLFKIKRVTQGILGDAQHWSGYLLYWSIGPMLFFTMAGNILPSYALPAIPAIGFLTLELWEKSRFPDTSMSRAWFKFYSGSLIVSILIVAATLVAVTISPQSLVGKKSQKFAVDFIHHQPNGNNQNIYYWKKRFYSAEFYSQGHAKTILDLDELRSILDNDHSDFVVMRTKDLKHIPEDLQSKLLLQKEIKKVSIFTDSPTKQ